VRRARPPLLPGQHKVGLPDLRWAGTGVCGRRASHRGPNNGTAGCGLPLAAGAVRGAASQPLTAACAPADRGPPSRRLAAMSLALSNGPASSNANHAASRKAVTAIESQALTVKNVRGVPETVRVAWIVQELRGVVAVVDIIAAVRGLAHKEAAHFFSEQKENWQRSQTLRLERIALTEITGNGSSECGRPVQDVEVCALADLHKVIEAIASVQGQPAGADDVCSRLERSVQEWARIRLEQRLRELSDDQANIKVALQSVFASRELPKLSSAADNKASGGRATSSVSTATSPTACAQTATSASAVTLAPLSNPPAPLSNPPAPRSNPSTSSHGSPYIGPTSGVPTPLTGFWLYDPAPPAPQSRGGGSSSAARLPATSHALTGSTGTAAGPSAGPLSDGSPRLAGQTLGLSIGPPASHGGSASAALPSLLSASSSNGASSASTTTQAGQSRKRPREPAPCIPAQALSFNQMTGGPELFRCTLCGVEVANRDDGAILVSDVAVAVCGHLYCTGCLAGSMLSGLPDEVYKCRRCGLQSHAYDRLRPGFATQRVEPFKVASKASAASLQLAFAHACSIVPYVLHCARIPCALVCFACSNDIVCRGLGTDTNGRVRGT
jgi:hypothetical protein